MERIIKKYANRKLYDTEARRFIALAEIAAVISEGDRIRVIDNETGKDVTTVILAQIILEQEKEKKGLTSISPLLHELIRRGRSSISEFIERSLLASVETLSLTRDKAEEIVGDLVRRRRLSRAEGQRLRDRLLGKAKESKAALHDQIESKIHRIVEQMDAPTREEISHLKENLRLLHEKLDALIHPEVSQRGGSGV